MPIPTEAGPYWFTVTDGYAEWAGLDKWRGEYPPRGLPIIAWVTACECGTTLMRARLLWDGGQTTVASLVGLSKVGEWGPRIPAPAEGEGA